MCVTFLFKYFLQDKYLICNNDIDLKFARPRGLFLGLDCLSHKVTALRLTFPILKWEAF